MKTNFGLIGMVLLSILITGFLVMSLSGCKKEPLPKSYPIAETPGQIGSWQSFESYSGQTAVLVFDEDSVYKENMGFAPNGKYRYQMNGDTLMLERYGEYYHELLMYFDDGFADAYEILLASNHVMFDRWFRLRRE